VNIFFTFDYELFLGNSSGSPERCIIRPTEALMRIAATHGVRFVFFVDSGYLARLASDRVHYPALEGEYDAVLRQIDTIKRNKHEVQLHVHPGWRGAIYNGGNWKHDNERYRLQDYSKTEAREIILEYARTLEEIAQSRALAYRAGGWCIQPFKHIAEALWEAGIRIDSTVIPGAFSSTGTHEYDFKTAPADSRWRFSDDPSKEDRGGRFLEIPIGAQTLGPWFFVKFSATKLLSRGNSGRFSQFGDGSPIGSSKREILVKFLKKSVAPISCDGYRSASIENSYFKAINKNPNADFVVIGHPKAQSRFSLETIDRCIATMKKDPRNRFMVFSEATIE
jgi:hypothetical protein